jgi:hypothetical protein
MRPGPDEFAQATALRLGVFIFTASVPEFAVPVVTALIPGVPVANTFTRSCRTVVRDLVRVVRIDTLPERTPRSQKNWRSR